MLTEFASHVNKDQLLNSYRTFGFIDNLLEDDLKNRYAKKNDPKDVQITYDLLPDGTVQNFTVKPY